MQQKVISNQNKKNFKSLNKVKKKKKLARAHLLRDNETWATLIFNDIIKIQLHSNENGYVQKPLETRSHPRYRMRSLMI